MTGLIKGDPRSLDNSSYVLGVSSYSTGKRLEVSSRLDCNVQGGTLNPKPLYRSFLDLLILNEVAGHHFPVHGAIPTHGANVPWCLKVYQTNMQLRKHTQQPYNCQQGFVRYGKYYRHDTSPIPYSCLCRSCGGGGGGGRLRLRHCLCRLES